ncbi:GtrA family protein [Candidatus Woesearchaeota archaeon]|nr:GtrA family protein [Candidatus Woesearchaeota archaeon]
MKKLFDAVEKFFEPFVPGQLKRPYSIGFRYSVFVFGGLIGYLLYYGAQEYLFKLGIARAIDLAVGSTLAVLFTFTYHRYITFDQKTGWKGKLMKFAPIQVSIAATNVVLSFIAIEHMHFPSLQATFVITFGLSLFNFAMNKLFIFRKEN